MKGILLLLLFTYAAFVHASSVVGVDVCPIEQEIDWSIEYLMRHENCNMFYQCVHGKPVERYCYRGLHFDLNSWRCEWPHLVDCEGRITPAPPAPTTTENTTPASTTTTTNVNTTTPAATTTPSTTTENTTPASTTTTATVTTTTPAPTTTPSSTTTTDSSSVVDKCPVEQEVDWTIEHLMKHENCNMYYQCVHGKPVERYCYPGLYFDIKTWRCEWPDLVDCDGRSTPAPPAPTTTENTTPASTTTTATVITTTTAPTTTSSSTTTTDSSSVGDKCPVEQEVDWTIEHLMKHENCNMYYQCVHGKPVERYCYPGLYFDIKTWRCEWPDLVDCDGRSTPAPPAPTTTENTTPASTTTTATVNTTTPAPTTTQSTTTTTDSSSVGDKCPVEQEVDWTIEHLMKHENCNMYYQCVHGKPVERYCYPGLYFDIKTWRCEWPDLVDCDGRNTPAPPAPTTTENTTPASTTTTATVNTTTPVSTTTQSTTTTTDSSSVGDKCPVEQEVDWTIEHLMKHENCNMYYQCVHGKPVERYCYPGLYFDIKTWQCEWPYLVDCEGRITPAPPAPTTTENTTPASTTTTANVNTTTPAATTTPSTTTENTTPASTTTTATVTTTTPAPTTTPSSTTTTDSSSVVDKCPVEQEVDWTIEHLMKHENCNMYYQCVHGKPVERYCYPGLYFDIKTWRCEWPDLVDCDGRSTPAPPAPTTTENTTPASTTTTATVITTTTAPTTTSSSTTTTDSSSVGDKCPVEQEVDWTIEHLMKHENCNMYYQCVHGKPVERYCYPGLYFDIKTWRCEWPDLVDCDGRSTPAPPAPTTTENTTPASTTTTATVNTTTPAPTTTQSTTTTTDSSSVGDKCPVEQEVDWTIEHLMKHENCNMYYQCVHGKPVERYCYPGLYFDIKTWRCEWPDLVDCDGRNTPAPPAPTTTENTTPASATTTATVNTTTPVSTTTQSTTTTTDSSSVGDKCPVEQEVDWTIEHLMKHENCNMYYQCVHGKPVERYCYPGLYFDIKTWQCEWPHLVDCEGRITPAPPAPTTTENTTPASTTTTATVNTTTPAPTTTPSTTTENTTPASTTTTATVNTTTPAATTTPSSTTTTDSSSVGDKCPVEQEVDWTIEHLMKHENCNMYYQCVHGKPVERYCYPGLYFDIKTWRCEWPDLVDCDGRNTPAPPAPTTTENTTPASTTTTATVNTTTPAPTTTQSTTTTTDSSSVGDKCPVEQEVDWTIEHLMKHENCNMYYQCVHGKPVERYCYPGLYFDIKTWRCEWPDLVDCDGRNTPALPAPTTTENTTPASTTTTATVNTTTPVSTTTQSTTTTTDSSSVGDKCPVEQEVDWTIEHLMKHENCNMYYQCVHGKPVERYCYPGLYFDIKTWQCEWPHLVDCEGRITPAPPAPTTTENTTPASTTTTATVNTTTPAPTTTPSTTTENTTPASTTTTATVNTTTPAATTTPSSTTTTDSSSVGDKCPVEQEVDWTIEHLMKHENCNMYYQCVHGKPVERYCYPGLYFDIKTWRCEWPDLVDCDGRNTPAPPAPTTTENTTPASTTTTATVNTTTPAPTTTQSTTTTTDSSSVGDKCPVEQEVDWTIEHLMKHENCNMYYQCVHGKPVERYCYPGLYFDIKTWRCEWPHLVDCEGRITPAPPSPTTTENTTPASTTTTATVNTTTPAPTTTPSTTTENTTPASTTTTATVNTTTPAPTTTPSSTTTTDSSSVGDKCPVEQEVDWTIEHLMKHENCNMYYQCVHGKPVERYCYPGLYFDIKTWRCEWPNLVDCDGRNTPAPPAPTTTENTTPASTTTTATVNTTTPAPTTTPSTTTENTTPASTTTTATVNTTTPAPTTTPSSTTTTDSSSVVDKCPVEQEVDWTIEHLMKHENCNMYYQCVHGKPVERYCYPGLYFDIKTWRCEWPDLVDCDGRITPAPPAPTTTENTTPASTTTTATVNTTTPAPTTTQSTTTTTDSSSVGDKCPVEQEVDWTIEHLMKHENCNMYYQCVHGKPVERYCYPGLYFDIKTWQCEWPDLVDCDGRITPAPPAPTTTENTTPASTTTTAPVNTTTPTPTTTSSTTTENTTPTSTTTTATANTTTPAATTTPSTTTTTNSDTEFRPNGCPVNPHIHWLLPHECDCNLYYYCVWGLKVVRPCPGDLHFNRRLQVCDHQVDAGCI